jgi:predicted metal-dependent peptidase
MQADTQPCLYFKYTGEKPVAGRGGTQFEPAIQWLNQARTGAKIKVKHKGVDSIEEEMVRLKVDGAIYLTDGYAKTPTTRPYCRMMWVITPGQSTDEYIKKFPHHGSIIHLPPYDNR